MDDLDYAGIAKTVRSMQQVDSSISGVRSASNQTVDIFNELDSIGANIPFRGRVSAMDVVKSAYPGLESAERAIRSLNSELNSWGENTNKLVDSTSLVAELRESGELEGDDLVGLFTDAASSAQGAADAVSTVKSGVSEAQSSASRLESALRDASDTPIIGGAIGGLASTAGRFETKLGDLTSLLGDFESDLDQLRTQFQNGLASASTTREGYMSRSLAQPHDPQWPPTDPERRPAGVSEMPTVGTPKASEAASAQSPFRLGAATPTPAPVTVAWGSEEQFTSVSAGYVDTCGVKVDGSIACWGWNKDAFGMNEVGQATPPAGEFVSVSAGEYHTCGVKVDGSVACWGNDDAGQATPPAGEFTSVSAGKDHTCGVRRDGSVACWGSSSSGQVTPPAGEFASVSAGEDHNRGVQRDGSVACWGYDADGQATPPAGEFASVSAGGYYFDDHTCGVQRGGTVACWGNVEYGQATPPAGEFASVSAGFSFTCGVKRDGSVACWGGQVRWLTAPPSG